VQLVGRAGDQEWDQQILRHHHHAVAELVGDVGEVRVRRDGQVGRQGPRGGGPDHQPGLLAGQLGIGQVALQIEGDVDRRRGVIRVLHLRLGQRGVVGDAPVDRLLAAVEVALGRGLGEGPDDLRLVLLVHGEVRLVPAREQAEPLELALLPIDPLLRVAATGGDDRRPVHLALLGPELLVDAQLDRETVAVGAGEEVGHLALHVPILDDDVLEDLVERVAEVDVPVGVGRTIVKHEAGSPSLGVLGHEAGEDPLLLPLLQELRLPNGEVGLHGEVGLGKIDGILVVHGSLAAPLGRGRL